MNMTEEQDTTNEWEKYFDHESNAYYWHNVITGESRWEDDDTEDTSFPEEASPADKKKKRKDKRTSKEREKSIQDELTPTASTKKKKRKKKNKGRNNSEDDEFIELLQEQDVANRTGADISRYRQCFYLNVLLLEYPLVVLEGFVRVAILALMTVTLLVVSMILWGACSGFAAQKCFNFLHLTGREVILTSAATLTLLIPFMILFVYRDYDAEHAWDLSAVPTIVGPVDARRFGVVTLGHGSDADNVNVLVESKSMGTRGNMSDRRTHDSWGGGNIDYVCLFPRDFLTHILE